MNKRLLVSGIVLLSAIFGYAQHVCNHVHAEYRAGEVIVKLKPSSDGSLKSGNVPIADALKALGVSGKEELMPLTGAKTNNVLKSGSTNEVDDIDLDELYRMNYDTSKYSDVHEVVEALESLPEVEFAEPNYLVHTMAVEGEDDEVTYDDPLYSEQYGIPAVNLPKLWNVPTNGKRPIIAILDTGVDIEHPDLKDNVWTNEAESSGMSGYDDDANGFKDDVHGWDFVNQTATMKDRNGHGTHCAGIAAAVGNNGIGIVGANPDALIMPITVMQSDGTGDVATIIKGIDYAVANGADVLSMSFGGYSYSIAEEQALAKAYQKAVLVAAAGNDSHTINLGHHCWHGDLPMFPGAFTFVLGVEATDAMGLRASFSNYDDDGPIFSAFNEEQQYNYELKAPGTNIMSTFPNGKYKKLNGTSMACPLAAGAISRLLQVKEYATKEIMFGDLIHTLNNNIDIYSAYNIKDEDRTPTLYLVSYVVDDREGDGDGRFDAGETIKIYPIIRNAWGTANNIKIWMEFDELDNDAYEILDGKVDFGKPLSSYAKATALNPITIKLNDDVVEGRHIKMQIHASCDNISAEMNHEIIVRAENGVEIGGMIDHDMVLYPNVNYIVTKTLVVPDNVTLTIKPGTKLSFRNNTGISFAEKAKAYVNGTIDSMIVFTNANGENYPMVSINAFSCLDVPTFSCCLVEYLGIRVETVGFTNSIFQNNKGSVIVENLSATRFVDCNIIYNDYEKFSGVGYEGSCVKNCNLVGNNFNFIADQQQMIEKLKGVNCFNNNSDGMILKYRYDSGTGKILTVTPNYYGSTIEKIVRKGVFDIEKDYGTNKFDLSNMLEQPNPNAHGIVWRIIVDGYDAQEEFELMPPLGVGKHKIEVWYSKKIDETTKPNVTMGIRPPYTQTYIGEDCFWRTEKISVKDYLLPNPKTGKSCAIYLVGRCTKTHNAGAAICVTPNGKINVAGLYTVKPDDGWKFYTHASGTGYDIVSSYQGKYLTIKDSTLSLSTTPGEKGWTIDYVSDKDSYFIMLDGKYLQINDDNSISLSTNPYINSQFFIDPLEEDFDYIEREQEVSVYTAYVTITGKMAIDGLNRLYVEGGEDLEHFEIPIENSRFNVEVSTAGSMSAGFEAIAGLGKVELTWEDQDENVDDILGYNLYRYQVAENSTAVASDENQGVKINESLLDEPAFTDYNVLPGETYYYYYKTMRTDMAENSPSKVVAATPLTASKGDANGSMSVDVADVVTEIAYLTNQDPQPFIFEAADVNSDETINILDVVGTVNVILNPDYLSSNAIDNSPAVYSVENGILYVETPVTLGGVQIMLNATEQDEITTLEALNGFEVVGDQQAENKYLFMAYSMSGKTLAPGKYALLNIADVMVDNVILSDNLGKNVAVDYEGKLDVEDMAEVEYKPYPNPFTSEISIPYSIAETGVHTVRIEIYDMQGRIQTLYNGVKDAGLHSYVWKSADNVAGTYIAILSVDGAVVKAFKLVKEDK